MEKKPGRWKGITEVFDGGERANMEEGNVKSKDICRV